MAFAVYGQARLVEEELAPSDMKHLRNMSWIGLGDTLSRSPAARWLRENIPDNQIKTTSDTFVAVRSLVRSGVGLAILPCCLGDPEPGLQQILPPITDVAINLWVLTHPDVRKAAKVRMFTSFVGRRLREQRALLEGTQ